MDTPVDLSYIGSEGTIATATLQPSHSNNQSELQITAMFTNLMVKGKHHSSSVDRSIIDYNMRGGQHGCPVEMAFSYMRLA